MIRNLCLVLFFSITTLQFYGCSQSSVDSIQIGVISDPHYVRDDLLTDSVYVQNYLKMSGKDIQHVSPVLTQILEEYKNSNIDVLLIPGDMTEYGDKQSHIRFREKLQPLIDKGVKIFVIPGNHDINIPKVVQVADNKSLRLEQTTPKEFAEIYADCGYKNALKRDTMSLSYVAELDKKTWLLAIDASMYQDYTTETLSSGRIQPETETWIMHVFEEAKEQNIKLVGMMHYGLVEHFPMQSFLFKDYLVRDWERFASLFADKGMKTMFTGHFHANDITEYKSESGNKVYDIETGSLITYAYPYRFVELTDVGFKVTTKNIESLPNDPDLSVRNRALMKERARILATEIIKSKGIHIPEKTMNAIADLASEIFVQHLKGDEKMDSQMRETINGLIKEMEVPIPLSSDSFEFDFYPADNNVEIVF